MIKKWKLFSVIGIMGCLLLTSFPVNTKGMEALEYSPWELTFTGQGGEPYFQSSVEMEMNLKGFSTKDDISIFINKQKWEGDWEDQKNLKLIFREEGSYEIHLIHRNGFEESRKIFVELSNPSTAKIDTGSYHLGTWTNENILISVYGSKAASKISHYEYKIGDGAWNVMKDNQLKLKDNMDEIVLIRAISNAGREGEIAKVWCRIWKDRPEIPKVICEQKSNNGWYQAKPHFYYEMNQMDGPMVHVYASLTNLYEKQTQTEIDRIPQIKNDGRYLLKVWTKDEAGNKSEESFSTVCFVDTKAPEIFVKYQNINNIHGILKNQRATIKVRDQNLSKNSLKIETSGRQATKWKQEGDYYETEIVFDHDGEQNLLVKAEDMAGNVIRKEAKSFLIDTKSPEITIGGITDLKSYKHPVNLNIKIQDEHLDTEKTHIYVNGKQSHDKVIKKDGYYTVEVNACDLAGNQSRMVKKFIVNQKGIDIHFLQNDLRGRNISTRNLKPGFRVTSLEPVKVTEFLVNGQKVSYQWQDDKVYVTDPIADNGRCTISLSVKDASGAKRSSENITFFYDTKKPVIKIRGLDTKNECVYGEEIQVSLENEKDHWKMIRLDGKDIKNLKNKICFKNLEPGIHILNVEAYDLARNMTRKEIKFKVTKVIPEPVRKLVQKDSKIRKETKEQKENSKVYLWIFTSVIIAGSLGGFLYKKRLKP